MNKIELRELLKVIESKSIIVKKEGIERDFKAVPLTDIYIIFGDLFPELIIKNPF